MDTPDSKDLIIPTDESVKHDFLEKRNANRCGALSHAVHGLDLILLNPPFSSRGSSRCEIKLGKSSIRSGRALAFVLNALPYLTPDGEMIAILPAGSLKSEKDQKAWSLIRSTFEVAIAGTNGHKSFEGCFPRTVIVRIARREITSQPAIGEIGASDRKEVSLGLYRGRLPMHTARDRPNSPSVPLVHSTSLTNGRVDLTQFRANNAPYSLKGPVILLPRVGEPRKEKIALYAGYQLIALSDCVIGLKAGLATLKVLHQLLLSNWDEIEV